MRLGNFVAVSGLALIFLASCTTTAARDELPHGELVIVGGGGTTPAIQRRALELARGTESYVVVLPQASESAERGQESTQMWRDAGAAESVNLDDLSDRERARRELERADLIWFSGGDQALLMKALREADLLGLVRARYAAGATIGGTSAGAAVMSPLMLTGGGKDALVSLVPGSTELVEGLGLLPGTLVDQHFVARQRNTRLLGAVLEHPELVGIGIDERTAFIVQGRHAEVLGEGTVLIYDARKAIVAERESGKPSAARGIELEVLRSGMTHELTR